MKNNVYLALLRGINVGGKNIIRMSALKECFESMGLRNVTTYIQSGNVLFSPPARDAEALAGKIERTLAKRFGYASRIVLVSRKQLENAVKKAPKGFGSEPAAYRYDVIFLRTPLTAKAAMRSVSVKEGVDAAHAGKDVLYFSRLTAKAAQSRLSRLVGTPAYKNMTIRNWNTTTKLLALMNDADG